MWQKGGSFEEAVALDATGLYGLGSKRSLAQMEEFVGVDLSHSRITDHHGTRCGDLQWVHHSSLAASAKLPLSDGVAEEGSVDKECKMADLEHDMSGVGGVSAACHNLGYYATLEECEVERKRRRCGALTFKHRTCLLHDPFGDSLGPDSATSFDAEPTVGSVLIRPEEEFGQYSEACRLFAQGAQGVLSNPAFLSDLRASKAGKASKCRAI